MKNVLNLNKLTSAQRAAIQDILDNPPAPKMKTVRSLMSGIEIEIAEDTPRCCDPSTETYWSM